MKGHLETRSLRPEHNLALSWNSTSTPETPISLEHRIVVCRTHVHDPHCPSHPSINPGLQSSSIQSEHSNPPLVRRGPTVNGRLDGRSIASRNHGVDISNLAVGVWEKLEWLALVWGSTSVNGGLDGGGVSSGDHIVNISLLAIDVGEELKRLPLVWCSAAVDSGLHGRGVSTSHHGVDIGNLSINVGKKLERLALVWCSAAIDGGLDGRGVTWLGWALRQYVHPRTKIPHIDVPTGAAVAMAARRTAAYEYFIMSKVWI